MNQRLFARNLRIKNGVVACDEVFTYGCIADVIALDMRKKRIIEYEFKSSSYDLKVAEKKKRKYSLETRYISKQFGNKQYGLALKVKTEPQKPHKFYYVMPLELYKKEKEYLKNQGSHVGVIAYYGDKGSFYVEKRCIARKSNLQKFDVVMKDVLNRLSNIYAWG